MGRKINTTQPMVVDILLPSLTEMFSIQPSGVNTPTVQWYYANDNTYMPDRTLNPLILVPTLSVVDPDANEVFHPDFFRVSWFLLNESNGEYEIIESTDTSADYYVTNTGNLVVRKNVPYNASVSILCDLDYIDPRDSSITHNITSTILLYTNHDATVLLPSVFIDSMDGDNFNVFTDVDGQGNVDSTFTFVAKVLQNGEDVTSTSSIKWYALNGTTETEIDTLASDGFRLFPCYVSGQDTDTLVIDMMYAEHITIVARVMNPSSSPLVPYPTKDSKTIVWDEIISDAMAKSDNGGAVRTNTERMSFDTIVNLRGRTLTDEEKEAHLFMNWKRRASGTSSNVNVTEYDAGWGQSMTLERSILRQNPSTLVYAAIILAGAFEKVTDDNATVTDSGQCVYDRKV